MADNKVKEIYNYRQSIWLDFIDRAIMRTGKLERMIEDDGLRGVTSNPAIFEKAFASSADYDEDISARADSELSDEQLFYELAISDIRKAADLFYGVYNGKVVGADGFVSLEVSPELALETEDTISQALDLWQRVDRKNVMIKIPGTKPCLPAIRKAIAAGLNVNVTLLFGLERYEAVTDAIITGLEDRLAKGEPVSGIASVASFFLSRIDILVDPMLEEKGLKDLKGETAIALAKEAYAIYKRVFSGERWQQLADQGAKPQRLLWASTGVKDTTVKDTKYVEALIGPDTVNTAPLDTINAFRDHGIVNPTLESGLETAGNTLRQVKNAGIDLEAVSQQLETEGIQKFKEPYQKMLQAIAAKRKKKKEL
ncbi:transaldolase [Mucilaginibacter sp. L3T2-6]|uniref:transaldolase n=1 Tax=Mucilaginibacter sp. L3T2-6 TaxID=3062491 RepID=UPI002674D28D|nr:transaldolase [Mucilaginibacter sp. L3T2-6]MDO3645241.1 transaldolase [Mucilaginibacter sp. L3T2-6]MDV6217693.1 transaldolase [Mucilaginibacter sp. L3T2-6]